MKRLAQLVDLLAETVDFNTGWKIYDLSVFGVRLAENYRNTFAEEIDASSIDGLIAKLDVRNEAIRAR